MKIYEVNNDPAIIDFEIPELSDIDFDEVFSRPSERLDYGELEVYEGRETINEKNYNRKKIVRKLFPFIQEMAEKVLRMDPIRYQKDQTTNFLKSDYRIGILLTKDNVGFSQPWHLDNRFIVLSGVINVKDNKTQTHFSKKNNHWLSGGTDFEGCDVFHKGRRRKFEGTCWLNTEITWHCVPKVAETRHIILFNVFF